MPGERLVDPVADVAHLERAALHAAEADLAREPAVDAGTARSRTRRRSAAGDPTRRSGRGTPRARARDRRCPARAAAPTARASRGTARGPRATRPSPRLRSGRSITRVPISSNVTPSSLLTFAPPPRSRRAPRDLRAPTGRPARSPVTIERIARRSTLALRVFGSARVNRTCGGLERRPERVDDAPR